MKSRRYLGFRSRAGRPCGAGRRHVRARRRRGTTWLPGGGRERRVPHCSEGRPGPPGRPQTPARRPAGTKPGQGPAGACFSNPCRAGAPAGTGPPGPLTRLPVGTSGQPPRGSAPLRGPVRTGGRVESGPGRSPARPPSGTNPLQGLVLGHSEALFVQPANLGERADVSLLRLPFPQAQRFSVVSGLRRCFRKSFRGRGQGGDHRDCRGAGGEDDRGHPEEGSCRFHGSVPRRVGGAIWRGQKRWRHPCLGPLDS